MTYTTNVFTAPSGSAPLERSSVTRRDVGEHDVRIDIEFAGICHSDIHTVREEWGEKDFPLTPGHEILGRVAEVGAQVTTHKVGDRVGVGCMVDSCGECEACQADEEQFCTGGATFTYGSPDPHVPGEVTQGGYSNSIVVTEGFVVSIPENLDPAAATPLLCAGITVYSPLKRLGAGPGKVVGVAGIGGLGHMAVKIAAAMGAHVVAFTTSPEKVELCTELGANEVLITTNKEAMRAARDRFDVIISTLPSNHDMNPYIGLLARGGTYAVVGALDVMTSPFNMPALIRNRRSITGSLIGGIAETQEMLNFCGDHNIVSHIELITADQINEAYDRVVAGDVKFRFVIDATTI
jgi:uncharacterized zinc-type alcohol dehydrogenase-like protein